MSGVALKGGYNGYWAEPNNERDIIDNQTILSGDIKNTPNNPNDDGYHVINANETSANTLLDGFIITKGNASGEDYPYGWGGGMLAKASHLTVRKCVFEDNRARNRAGAVFITGDPKFRDCIFYKNRAYQGGGGAVDIIGSPRTSPEFTNCVFTMNTASGCGGAMSISYDHTKITNCTFAENSVDYAYKRQGDTIYYDLSSAKITNCIFWDDPIGANDDDIIYCPDTLPLGLEDQFPHLTFTNCNIIRSGGSANSANWSSWFTDAGGNIDVDPLFLNMRCPNYDPKGSDRVFFTTNDGLYLQSSSPCIDQANGEAPDKDILGNVRNPIPDLGAYERTH
jgi:hypothetical protein